MKQSPSRVVWLAILLASAGLSAPAHCADIKTVVDRSTGTTLQVTTSPWIMAFEQPLLAANSRDYVGLYAVEASNGGKHHYYIAAFFWSTVPGRNRYAGDRPSLTLLLDDRELTLEPAAVSLRDSGIGRWPLPPPGRDALLMLYKAEPALMRHLGHASQLRLRPQPAPELPPELWFESWRNGSASFRSFVATVIVQP